MKTIGIATIYNDSTNYGGCLQALALCDLLKKQGYNPIQIKYKSIPTSINQRIIRTLKNKRILRMVCGRLVLLINSIKGDIFGVDKEIMSFKKSFICFRDMIPHTEEVYTDISLSFCTYFDIYITGSDQVWNVGEACVFSDFYWLNFVPDGKKKISYAASISKRDFPEELYPKVRELLSDYSAISVREKQDKELLDKIIGKDKAQWVLDPTLLLSRDDWEQLCEENPFKSEHYVFTYLLGDNKKQRQKVTEWAKKNNRIIINIPYLLGQYRSCDKKFGDIRKSDVTPNLWLSLIRDADCVFTDSFHACVFSSIFQTPFYVFKRCKDSSKASMNSRIYSLMELFETEDRIIDGTAPIDCFPNLESIDFDMIDSRIAVEKEKSIAFLINALEG